MDPSPSPILAFMPGAVVVGYFLIRGALDLRDGRRWLGSAGIAIGVGLVALLLLPHVTPRVTVDFTTAP